MKRDPLLTRIVWVGALLGMLLTLTFLSNAPRLVSPGPPGEQGPAYLPAGSSDPAPSPWPPPR